VRDHVVLGRWLLALGVLAAAALAATIERTFPTLAAENVETLRHWFLLFAMFALSQIPMTLWLGVSQGAARYRTAFAFIALPRAGALLLLPATSAMGLDSGAAIGFSLLPLLSGKYC
jgi:NADH:ubiquinone oxidoreductase subunit 4 (subunit M)